jgi:phage recombination protein Bet
MPTQAVVKADPNAARHVAAYAERFSMDADQFESVIRATCFPPTKNNREVSAEEFAAFVMVAKEYNLNPLTREIYAYQTRGGGIAPIVSVDGWINLINSHASFDGIELTFDETENGKIVSCTASIWRKDRSRPTVVTEYFAECDQGTGPWKSHPHRMLRHKALIQCARIAFGFSGIYDEGSEAERVIDVSATMAEAPPPRPSLVNATPPEDSPQNAIEAPQESVTDSEVGREGNAPTDAASDAETDAPDLSDEDITVIMRYGDETGVPREKEFVDALIDLLPHCATGDDLKRLFDLNKPGLEVCSKSFRDVFYAAGKARRAELEGQANA